METPSPLDVVTRLVHAMNKGDLEIAVSLFEAGAAFVVKPGVVVTGTLAIRQALAGFMAVKPALTIEAHQIVEAGDVAQNCARWKIQGTDPAGNVVQMSGRSSSTFVANLTERGCSCWITRGERASSRSSPWA